MGVEDWDNEEEDEAYDDDNTMEGTGGAMVYHCGGISNDAGGNSIGVLAASSIMLLFVATVSSTACAF